MEGPEDWRVPMSQGSMRCSEPGLKKPAHASARCGHLRASFSSAVRQAGRWAFY